MRYSSRAAGAFVLLAILSAASTAAQTKWWMEEPVRLIQTNLREVDSGIDGRRLVQQVAEFPANTLLINMGGIVAQYPTTMDFHMRVRTCLPARISLGRRSRRRICEKCASSVVSI